MAVGVSLRQDMVERLDALAVALEAGAHVAVRDREPELAHDLWLSSARVLRTADELAGPVQRAASPAEPDALTA